MAVKQRTVPPAKTKPSSPSAPQPAGPSSARAPSTDAIAIRAYELWRQSGGGHGNDQAHWFQAERELRGRTALR